MCSQAWVFMFFAACVLLVTLFVITCLPETKGVPMEKIEQAWEGQVTPHHTSVNAPRHMPCLESTVTCSCSAPFLGVEAKGLGRIECCPAMLHSCAAKEKQGALRK